MKRIVVLGGGESGAGSAVLAKVKGFDVFLSDNGGIAPGYRSLLEKWEIPYESGGHTEALILNADEIIKSPGIPSDVPIVRKAVERGIHIISEIEFAGRWDKARKICITGSNGKTTTTSLIYHMLKQAGLNVGLGGNIGRSYAYQVATCDFDVYVLELSSFQLDNVYDFKADIAIITNITPDHLDRYGHDFGNYVKAKFRITRNMNSDDCFIFCSDDEVTADSLNRILIKAKSFPFSQKRVERPGAFLRDEKIVLNVGDAEDTEIAVETLSLSGKHNVYNSMAAALAAKLMNVSDESLRKSLASFPGVEHRLEFVRDVKGVRYVNDSKATNVDAAWYALECQTRPVVWIVGGKDKGNDYTPLLDLARNKVKAIVCMGVDNAKIHDSFAGVVPAMIDTASAEDAVRAAASLASEGDIVLLSPCCASFDLFRSYEDRGKQFKEAVMKL